jgi:predicted Zn-dependent peptidase
MIVTMLALLATASPDNIDVTRVSAKHPRVVTAVRPTPDATLRVVFRAGAADDGIEYGKTRLAQFYMTRGARNWLAFDEQVYAAGGTLEIVTGIRDCAFVLTAPKSAFDKLAPQLLKMVFAPTFAPDGFERARKIVATDYLQPGSEADLYAFVASQVMLTEGVEGGGDYNNPIWGDPDTVKRMSELAVRTHIKEKMTPANATVIAAGAFNPTTLRATLKPFAGGSERAQKRPDLKQYLPLEFSRWAPREIHLHLQLVDVSDAASIANTHVLASLLQDRIFWRLRKTGHVYGAFVLPVFEEWLDFLLVLFMVTPGIETPADKIMIDAIDEVSAGEFTDVELTRAKAMAKGRLQTVDDNSAELAKALATESRGLKTVGAEIVASVDAVDMASLKNAAAHALGRERSINVLFGKSRPREKRRASAE